MNRRAFLRAVAGSGGAILLPPSVADNADSARRYWSLDNTMVGGFHNLDMTMTFGLWDVDAIAAMTGGTVSTTGTAPPAIWVDPRAVRLDLGLAQEIGPDRLAQIVWGLRR